jgi:hypothetical protein
MNPHARTFKDLDTPLSRLGTRALIHPRSTFTYVPAVATNLRATFARIRNEQRKLRIA